MVPIPPGLRIWIAALLCAGSLAAVTSARQSSDPPPQESAALTRAREYVETFITKLSNVVADETYEQQRTRQRRRRELKSEFVLVSLPGSGGWLQLRGVYEVDGKSVLDRQERLAALLGGGSGPDGLTRALTLTRDNARYNLGEIGTLNVPLVALSFLQSRHRAHFEFVSGPIDRKSGAAARLLEFRERGRRMYPGRPVRGHIWVDDNTGVVLQTELLIGYAQRPNQILTFFKPDADLRVSVPVEMREWYGFLDYEVTSRATYGRFRAIGPTTCEEIS